MAQHFCPPATPQGLLEPDAGKRRTSGSEGGRAQQCARPTRPAGIVVCLPFLERSLCLRAFPLLAAEAQAHPEGKNDPERRKARAGKEMLDLLTARLPTVTSTRSVTPPMPRGVRACRRVSITSRLRSNAAICARARPAPASAQPRKWVSAPQPRADSADPATEWSEAASRTQPRRSCCASRLPGRSAPRPRRVILVKHLKPVATRCADLYHLNSAAQLSSATQSAPIESP